MAIAISQRAAMIRVAPAWLCAAAWMRAIPRWNDSQGLSAKALLSLEFPVSLRRGRYSARNGHGLLGNFSSSDDKRMYNQSLYLVRTVRRCCHFPALHGRLTANWSANLYPGLFEYGRGSSGARLARVRTDISALPSHSTFSSGGRPVN